MSHSEIAEKYADYVAAKAYRPEWGSATNVDELNPFSELDTSNIATSEPMISVVTHPRVIHLSATSVPNSDAWIFSNFGQDITTWDVTDIVAFDKLDEIQTAVGDIRQQILGIRTGSRLPYWELLAERLELLVDAMHEEGEAWADNSGDSLRKMLMFLETVPHFRLPAITITPAATFRAQWTEDNDSHFAVDFLPDGQVHFVVFCPSSRHPGRVKRVAGKSSWETLMAEVLPYEVSSWSRHAR